MSPSIMERKAIGLCVALEATNDMANYVLLDLPRQIEPGQELEIRYKTRVHQQLFLISSRRAQ